MNVNSFGNNKIYELFCFGKTKEMNMTIFVIVKSRVKCMNIILGYSN
jgi:hypothetical protein